MRQELSYDHGRRLKNLRLYSPEHIDFIGNQGALSRPICDLRVVTAMRLIERRLDQPITTTALADAVGLSRFYFIRLFQDQAGETIMDYIRRMRLERSAAFLLNSSDSIVQIGFSVGYGSQSAFTRAFTHQFDIPPADYRRTQRQVQINDLRASYKEAEVSNIQLKNFAAGSYFARRYLGVNENLSFQWDDCLRDIRLSASSQVNWSRIEVVYDDDRITEPERMRADFCLSMPAMSQQAQGLCGKGFQAITLPPSIYAVITMPRDRSLSDRDSGVLLDAWLGQQKRYRRRTSGATLKCWSNWDASPADRPDRILVPLDMI